MNADINERRAAISGVGLALAGRRDDRSALDLTLDAIFEALGDAGLSIADIDGLSSWPGVSVTPGMAPVAGLIPYVPNTPLWSDGAAKPRCSRYRMKRAW